MTGWIIVTGASSGIGKATAKRFLDEGYRVAAIARRADRLQELVEQYGEARVQPITADIRNRESVESFVTSLTADGSALLALVNNAGLSVGHGPFPSGDQADWQCMLDTNAEALIGCTSAVVPAMRAAGHGHILNVGSLAASYPHLGGNVYAASKAFVHHLTANLRVDLQDSGIRVTCVAPGMVRTEFAVVRYRGDEERAATLYRNMRVLDPEDVADALYWAFNTPGYVNVNYLELMPLDQPFGLALRHADRQKESS